MKIHFIGICGVAMSALAIAFKKAGFEVSGSDVGFFPPVSTNLEKHNIKFYPGWHPEKMGQPDLVIVGNVAGSTNPEWIYVQENRLNYLSYPEAIEKFFIKENSIVCAGTYGKTSTSALLAWILSECGYDPSYMFGGIAVDDFDSASLGNEPRKVQNASEPRDGYSVTEGDEYKSARWDNGAKFFHYHPTHLLLTGLKWDHADVYPTEESYFEAFDKLIKSVPEKGLIVVNEHVSRIMYHVSNVITYGRSNNNNYFYSEIKQNENGIEFKITTSDKCYVLRAMCYGEFNAANLTGAFAMACEIGIEPEKIISAIASFKGIKRRLEKRYEGRMTVFDDIAHSPAKAESVLETLRTIYSDSRVTVVFEPNTGNRQPQSAPSYANAFTKADEIIIPKLTKLKTGEDQHHFDGAELAEVISKTHNNVKYIDDDDELINYLTNKLQAGDVVVFCGSHGFRGMIDELIKGLKG